MTISENEHYNFDKVLKRIGILGKYQIIVIGIFSFGVGCCGVANLAFIFIAAVPKYWCSSSNISSYDVSTESSLATNYTVRNSNPCSPTERQNGTVVTCDNWEFDDTVYGSTVVTKWLFVCSSEWLASLVSTTYMCGFLIGAFTSGIISDRFGRKKSVIFNVLLFSIPAIVASFMPNFWAFISMRLLSGIGNAGSFVSAIVLCMEILSERYRMKVGMYFQVPFSVGYMMLAGVAYFIRNYQYLTLFTGILPLLMLPFFWFVDESPRWLLTKGRFEEANLILQKMCERNNMEYPTDLMEKETELLLQQTKVDEPKARSRGIIDIVKTPRLLWRLIAVSYGWIVCSMTYYGLSQTSADLPGGPYLNLILSGLMEIPGIIVCTFIVDKIGRKWTMAGSFFIASVCLLSITFMLYVSSIVTSILSMTGKMAISGAFAIIYVYTIELFPTVIRTSAVGSGSMCARIGSIASPNIYLLSKVSPFLPFLVFGLVTFVGCVITLILPETFKKPYQETIEDGVKFGKSPLGNLCDFPCRKTASTDDNDNEMKNAENMLKS